MYSGFLLDVISLTNCVKNSLISDLKLLCWHRVSNSIACRQLLLPIEQEFLHMHGQMFYLLFSTVFWLAQFEVLSKYVLQLRDTPPLCASCLLGQAQQKSWRCKSSKVSELLVLRTSTMSKPGDCMDVDQLISAQPCLILWEKGALTKERKLQGVML